jgi:hypothetical protein
MSNKVNRLEVENLDKEENEEISFSGVFASFNSRETLVFWMVWLLNSITQIHSLPALCTGLHFSEGLVALNIK